MIESTTLQGKLIVVLGGSGGIGSTLCRRLVEQDADLLIAGRSTDRGRTLAAELGARWHDCDATDSGQVEALFARAAQMGTLYGAVNCVGSLLLKPAHLTTDAEWTQTIQLNLNTAFYVIRQATKMMQSTGGTVVLMSSAAGRIGLANHEAIAAAKAGIIGLMQSAAASYGPRGIRVNCVAPGLVDTPLTNRITSNEASLKASQSMHVLGRIGQPEQVASAISWLLHPEQGWVTGQVIGIDGGLGTVRGR